MDTLHVHSLRGVARNDRCSELNLVNLMNLVVNSE